jgi:hypothetical protein
MTVPAFADTTTVFSYNGTPSSTGANEQVEADFIVSGGNLIVTLYNTTPNLSQDKQILTGVAFQFAGGGSVAGTVTSPTVQDYTISGNNLVANQVANANWHTELDLTGYVTLTNLNNGNGGGSMGVISSSLNNPSNLSQHAPFITGPVQFTISGLGLTSSSQITSVQFNFGTGIGVWSPTVTPTALVATPEPGTIALSSLAFAGIALLIRRKKQAPQA